MSSTTRPGTSDRELQRSIDQLDEDTLRWALDLAQFVRHPLFLGTLFTAGLALAGTVVMVISGLGVNDQYFVSLQYPYLISGGFGGLALMICGAFVASILGHRRDEAATDVELGEVLDDIAVVTRLALRRRATAATATATTSASERA